MNRFRISFLYDAPRWVIRAGASFFVSTTNLAEAMTFNRADAERIAQQVREHCQCAARIVPA